MRAICSGAIFRCALCSVFLALGNVATSQIVALGASNTYGTGVPRSAAYPAQLEALLNARGLALKVTNAGVRGETVSQMLSRIDAAVPNGTRLVIFQPGGNDARAGVDPQTIRTNTRRVVHLLRRRGIAVVLMRNSDFDQIPADMRQSDHIHLTAEGYKRVAEELLPRVLEALKEP